MTTNTIRMPGQTFRQKVDHFFLQNNGDPGIILLAITVPLAGSIPPIDDFRRPKFALCLMWLQLLAALACYFAACYPRWRKTTSARGGWRIRRSLDVWMSIVAGVSAYMLQEYVFGHLAAAGFRQMHLPVTTSFKTPPFVICVSACTIAPIAEESISRGGLMLLWNKARSLTNTHWRRFVRTVLFVLAAVTFGLFHLRVHYTPAEVTVMALTGSFYGAFALWRKSFAQSAIAHAVANSIILAANPLLARIHGA